MGMDAMMGNSTVPQWHQIQNLMDIRTFITPI